MTLHSYKEVEQINILIRILGEGLKDRLPIYLIQNSLSYIEYNEFGLAFETLCDHIDEHGIKITSSERDSILNIANMIGYSKEELSFLL